MPYPTLGLTYFCIAALLCEAPFGGHQELPKLALMSSANVRQMGLAENDVYSGWRASVVLGQKLVSKSGRDLGIVRNLLIDQSGQIQAVLVENLRRPEEVEYMSRIPWDTIEHTVPGQPVANVPTGSEKNYPLFLSPSDAKQSGEFPVTEVIGDFARLQAGQGYGYVTDVVFTPSGRMVAILVARDARAGGGTLAFGFPGKTGRWEPTFSYYGLPFVTAEQANGVGIEIDVHRFRSK